MMVADGQADFMILANSVTHKWDTCAGEAVIRSMGGTFTDVLGNPLIYESGVPTSRNSYGVLAAMDKDVHHQVINLFQEEFA